LFFTSLLHFQQSVLFVSSREMRLCSTSFTSSRTFYFSCPSIPYRLLSLSYSTSLTLFPLISEGAEL
jgi:hypothetical protein